MLGVAQWVVTLLFFCIEILPVMVKVLLNIGPLSNYEELLKNEEDIITDQAKLNRVTKRRDAQRRGREAEGHRQAHAPAGGRSRQEGQQHVAQHMEAILDVALADWSRQVQAKLSGQRPPGSLPGRRVVSSGPEGGMVGRVVRAPPAARPSMSPPRSRG